jgi:uncharacterized membrane protein
MAATVPSPPTAKAGRDAGGARKTSFGSRLWWGPLQRSPWPRSRSPRALTILLGDRPTHFTIGVFVGTFTYALVVLLCLRVATDDDAVSGLSLTTAFGLAILTIGTFAVYSNHIIHSVRATSLIHRICSEARETIDQLYPPFGKVDDERTAAPDRRPDQVLQAPKPGVLVDVDDDELLRQAASAGCALVVVPPIGAFVPARGPLLAVRRGRLDAALVGAVELADERDMRLDASFGLRQLMDIAARALSPGVNNPATALQVLDKLHDLLRRLVQRRLRHGHRHDATWQLRVVLRIADWDEIVALTLDEMRRLATGSMAVHRRLRAILEDLLTVAPPPRQQALEQQLALLERAVASGFSTDFERHLACQADPRGTGF